MCFTLIELPNTPMRTLLRRSRPLTSAACRRTMCVRMASTAEQDDLVLLERKDNGVAVITLNNAPKLNALSVRMGNAFEATVQQVCAWPDLRACVLRGSGRVFSAGGDLSFLMDRMTSTPEFNKRTMLRFYERFTSIRRVPVPVISAIHGHAVGAGFGLAMLTDIRIAHNDASNRMRLGVNFTRLGISPGMLTTHTFPPAAHHLLLTGELVDASVAHSLGLLHEVVADADAVFERSFELAQSIATASPVSEGLNAVKEKRDPHFAETYFRPPVEE